MASDPHPIAGYHSRFGNWDQRASVRVRPRHDLPHQHADRVYFPPELVPAAAHPLVVTHAADAPQRLLLHRLYQYLHFTIDLEAVAVIPVATMLSRGVAGLDLPAGMQSDAFKITTDEAWHAQFSDHLVAQLRARTGIQPRLPRTPQFMRRIADASAALEPGLAAAQQILFAIVSETLISGTLRALPRDERLPSAVREYIADHADDEGRHHAYFHDLLTVFWPALTGTERRALGPQIPTLVRAFLEPDLQAVAFALFDVGLRPVEATQVLDDYYRQVDITAGMRTEAQLCLRYFEDVGAFDDPATRDACEAAGLR